MKDVPYFRPTADVLTRVSLWQNLSAKWDTLRWTYPPERLIAYLITCGGIKSDPKGRQLSSAQQTVAALIGIYSEAI